jgi:predicted MFS family arabinose efflux permease
MGAAALGTLNVTVTGDIYGGRERAAALGYNSSVLSAGTASYPVIGDALARFGWFYPFALPLIAIPVGIFAVFSLRNPEPESEQGLKEYFRSTRRHLPDREVVGLVGVSLLKFVVLLGPQFSYLHIPMNDRFDAPTPVIGGVLSGASDHHGLGLLPTRPPDGALPREHPAPVSLPTPRRRPHPGRRDAHPAPAPDTPPVLFGVARGSNLPNVLSLLNSHAPSENRGAFMAANGMALRTAQTVGPLLMVSLAGSLGATGAYLATAIIALAAFLLAFVAVRQRRGPGTGVTGGNQMVRFCGMQKELSTICCG